MSENKHAKPKLIPNFGYVDSKFARGMIRTFVRETHPEGKLMILKRLRKLCQTEKGLILLIYLDYLLNILRMFFIS